MTYTIKIASQPAEDAVSFSQGTVLLPAFNGVGANVTNSNNADIGYRAVSPCFGPERRVEVMGVAAGSGGATVNLSIPSHWRDLWTTGRWDGAAVALFRVSNGVFSRVGESTVTAHRATYPRTLRDLWSVGVVRVLPSTLSFVWRLHGSWAPGATIWVGLVGYATDGTTGPAAWQQITLPDPVVGAGTATPAPTLNGPDAGVLDVGANGSITAPTFTIAPAGVSGETAYEITVTGHATGHDGYALIYSEVDPLSSDYDRHDLTLADSLGAREGDMIFVAHDGLSVSRDMFPAWRREETTIQWRRTVFGWNDWYEDDPARRVTWAAHQPSDYPGAQQHYAQIAFSGGASGGLRLSATRRLPDDFYPQTVPGVTYRSEVWLRGTDATYSVEIAQSGAGDVITAVENGTGTAFPVTFTPGVDWTLCAVEFQVGAEGGDNTALNLEITAGGSGATVGVSRPRFYNVTDDPTRMATNHKTRMAALGLEHIRNHATVKTAFSHTYDLAGYITEFGYCTHGHLADCAELGTRPWLQPEFHIFAFGDTRRNWAEYLCAPASAGPWAALRASLGQSAPWVDVFDRIYHEGSNEVWNGALAQYAFYTFPSMMDVEAGNAVLGFAEVQGHFHKWMVDGMRAHPDYPSHAGTNADKIQHVLGGWFIGSIDHKLAANAGDTAHIYTVAPYIGNGWESGLQGATLSMTEPTAALKTLVWGVTETPPRVQITKDWLASAKLAGANANLVGGTYEDGPTDKGDDIWPDVPMRWSRSKGLAQAFLEKMMIQALGGYGLQSFFTAGAGKGWHTHAPNLTTVWPCGQWIGWVNQHLTGATAREASNFLSPQRDMALINRSGDPTTYAGVKEIAIPAIFHKPGGEVVVPIFNHNLPYDAIDSGDDLYDANDDGARTVRVELGFAPSSVTRYRMTGSYENQNYDAIAATYADLAIVSEDRFADVSGTALVVSIPAAEAYMYVVA